MAPTVAAMDTGRPHATVGIGLAVPGRRIRSLVAEDRSAAGVRDRTGPEADAHEAHGTRHDTLG
jgi:hypothetical protein